MSTHHNANSHTSSVSEGAGKPAFEATINSWLRHFPKNRFCTKIDEGKLTMPDYHRLLKTLFHQVYFSANSFALAAAHCHPRQTAARDYLMKHAEEEKTHWTWILKDLNSTGYRGRDPRDEFPHEAADAYVAYNFYTAQKMPLGRLAIATMLESLAGSIGKGYSERMIAQLELKPEQAYFFFGHAESDVGHTEELWKVLAECEISRNDWGWMCQAAATAASLYFHIYDECAG